MCIWDYILEKYPYGIGQNGWNFEKLATILCENCIEKNIDVLHKFNQQLNINKNIPFDSIVTDDNGLSCFLICDKMIEIDCVLKIFFYLGNL